jgi:hypothetical protein
MQPDQGIPARESESVLRRAWAWHMHAPAERVPLALIAGGWPSAWVLHEAAFPAVAAGWTTAALTAAVAAAWTRHARKRSAAAAAGIAPPKLRLAPREAAAVTAACGGWLTAAAALGPGGWTGAAYAAGSAAGYTWLRCHAAVQEARERRDADAEMLRRKTWWHQIAPVTGLAGFSLQDVEATLLGEDLLLTSSPGTGLASRIAANSGGICESLEHLLDLEYGRVDIVRTRWPGQLRVSIRYVDPSLQGDITHPAIDPASQFAGSFPVPATIRDPQPLLVVPETAEVVSVPLWDENGGKVIGVYAAGGMGKTTVLNCLRERVTAMDDAVLVQVNGAKVGDELAWGPLAAATAAGAAHADEPAGTCARIIAVLEYAVALITERSATHVVTGDSVFQPTREDPAVVLILDELDEILRIPGAQRLIEFLASKRRSAAVIMLIATQRAIQQWTGGGGVRANLTAVLAGNMTRPSETRHATGAEYDIPDISAYSKGQPGFFQWWDPMAKAVVARGRAFNIGSIGQQQRHVIWHRDPALRPALPGPLLDLEMSVEPDDSTPEQATAGDDARGTQGGSLRARLGRAAALLGAGAPDPQPAPPPRDEPAAPVRMIPGVPAHATAVLLRLLAAGTTASEVAAATGVGKTKAHQYLTAARKHQVAVMTGGGHASRWRLAPPPGVRKPAASSGYGTIEALAEAVAAGHVEVDGEARELMEKIQALKEPRPEMALTSPGGDDTP